MGNGNDNVQVMKRIVLLALVSLGASCAPSEIKPDFARFSRCDEKEVKVTAVGATDAHNELYRANGCGQSAEYICSETQRCVSPQVVVVKRHASVFRCNVESIEVAKLDAGGWQTSGCGHQLTFNCLEMRDTLARCVAETESQFH